MRMRDGISQFLEEITDGIARVGLRPGQERWNHQDQNDSLSREFHECFYSARAGRYVQSFWRTPLEAAAGKVFSALKISLPSLPAATASSSPSSFLVILILVLVLALVLMLVLVLVLVLDVVAGS
jgi:hypothetical protein